METIGNYGKEKNFLQRAAALFGYEKADVERATPDSSDAPEATPPPVRALPDVTKRATSNGITRVGGRATQDNPEYFGNSFQSLTVFSPNSYWRQYALAENFSMASLQRIPIDKIAELLADISPEVSNALHIRTILSNTGYEIEAKKLDSDEKDEAAQVVLDEIRKQVANNYGTEDVFYNQLFTTLFMRGSILTESIFNGREMVDIATPDPKTLTFRKAFDPIRGTVNDYGQIQQGQFVSFREIETVKYVPLNPFPNKIEGRSIMPASFFISIFLMAILRDFKRVVQQQGYPRYDIEIDLDALDKLKPEEAETDATKFEEWANAVKSSVINYIESLEPDDTFVHYSGVTVNAPIGALGTNSLTAIDGLFKALERMAARALKVPPLFMGITDGVSEANANRQFEAFLKDLENGQHIIENAIGSQYKLGLEAKGIAARVFFRFATMRVSERLRDAQADLMEAQLAQLQYEMGWISQDTAAERGAKVEKSDQAEPRGAVNAAVDPNAAGNTDNVDAGANRLASKPRYIRMPTLTEIADARDLFLEVAPDEFADLVIAEPQNAGDNPN